jgi:hypothetical protein
MANPTGILNADEDHSARKITNVVHPPVADHDAATKKYVDDNILTGSTSDTAFGSSWNGVTTIAPSKNAVYDQLHLIDTDDDGKVNVLDTVAGLVKTNAFGVVSNAVAKTDYWDVTDFSPSGASHAHGLVPDPGASAGTVRFLREDATWITPGGTGTVTTTGSPVTGNLTKFSGATSITNGDLTGDVTTAGGLATTIANNAVSLAKMAVMTTDSILGRATAGTGNVEMLTALPFAFIGDVTRPADSNSTTIANSAVTYAKIQNVSANSKLLGSSATGTGAPPSEITLGTNLSMSGSTLNATGGGGGGTIASTSDILKGDGTGNAVALGSATLGKVLKSNGTAFIASTETYAAPGTSGNLLTSDGTNWTSATPVVTASSTTTFTNKRINPRVDASTSASATTWAPNSDTTDIFELAGALTVAVTTISNPSGTPVDGQKLIIRVKSDGSAHALTWSGSQWRASSDLALPTTTIISKTLYLGFIYNSVDTKWDLLALLNNF